MVDPVDEAWLRVGGEQSVGEIGAPACIKGWPNVLGVHDAAAWVVRVHARLGHEGHEGVERLGRVSWAQDAQLKAQNLFSTG